MGGIVKKQNSRYIRQERILAFVNAVERKKKYSREPGLVVRHLFEEAAECSRKVWMYEKIRRQLKEAAMSGGTSNRAGTMVNYISIRREIAKETVDAVCVALLLCDIVGFKFDEVFEERMAEVFKQYKVPPL